jgi:hypothetical protein
MVPKPQRTILGKVSSYAEEAAAYMRRRRITRTPFARVHYRGGRVVAYPPDTEAGRALFRAAANVIDAAREPGAPASR